MRAHYLFEDRFGRPGKGNDKGKVEGLVGFIRRNFLVPVPRAESFAALNDALAQVVTVDAHPVHLRAEMGVLQECVHHDLPIHAPGQMLGRGSAQSALMR